MYKKILLAYDGSDAGQKALLDCREVAQWSQAELHLVAVMPSAMSFVGLEGGVYDVELEEREKAKYRAVLDDGLRRLSEAGFSARGDVVTGEAVEEIRKYAVQIGADLIVVGNKRVQGITRVFGSIASHVAAHASCDLYIVHTHQR